MSYSRGLGAAVTCRDGSVIDVPAGGDANALCLAHHAASTADHTISDVSSVITSGSEAVANIIKAFQAPAPTTPTPDTSTLPPPTPDYSLPAPASTPLPGWVIPAAVGGGILLIGGILFLGKKKKTVTATITSNKRRQSKRRSSKRVRRNASVRQHQIDGLIHVMSGAANLPWREQEERVRQMVATIGRENLPPDVRARVERMVGNPRRRVSIKAKARGRRTRRAVRRAIWATPRYGKTG